MEGLDLERMFKNNEYPAIRIIYKGKTKSKVMRSVWIFEKFAFSAERYDMAIQIEVKKGESEIITIVLGALKVIDTGILLKFGDDIYEFLKKKILEQLEKEYKSEIKVETNGKWEKSGLPPINSDEIHEENKGEDSNRLHS